MTGNDSTVIKATSMRAYFHEALLTASRHQDVSINDDTAAYVINLLTAYCRANALNPVSDEGRYHKALATIYAEAVDADTPEQRNQGLQRLGDIALFIAGLFSDSLNRRAVDVDYYIGMGETAYGQLHDAMQRRTNRFERVELFADLQRMFAPLVDVLGEVSEMSGLSSDADTLRSYELWIRTGSERAARRLQRSGIVPMSSLNTRVRH